MKNFVASGDIVTIASPAGGVSSGQFVRVGALHGVAQADAADGEAVALVTSGIFELAVAATGGVTVGAPIYWTGSALTTAANSGGASPTAYDRVGVAVTPAASGASVAVDVKL